MVRVAIGRSAVELTNLDKVLYPETGFTKGQVIGYYQDISAAIIPHLSGRPVTVKRYPDGVAGQFFYEKRIAAKHPSFLHSTAVSSGRYGTIEFPVIDNAAALLWMVNRAAIEYHTYLYQGRKQDSPTMMVFDLDPGAPATLSDCLDIAVVLRDFLAELGLRSFPKTSGGKGLHLGVPLTGASFAAVKAFAHGIADALAQQDPKRVTSSMAKTERPGKVFIDWSQNDHGKTTACAYTLRAQASPTVSTPVAWEEVERARKRRKPDLLRFEAADVPKRIRELGDLFAPTLTLRQRLPRTGERLE
jgi:bifunctional non-homologous end joining protein LigD